MSSGNIAQTPNRPMPKPLWEKHHDGWFWEIKDYIMICIGTLLYTGGVSIFMLPYGLTTGGVSGVASIIYYATQVPVYISYFIINACFLVAAIKVLGWKFCVKTIVGVTSSTMWYSVWQFFLCTAPNQWPQVCGSQIFMACILGPIICGIGLSICFENHGSTGGTDIIAAIVNKYKDVSLGQIILLCDILIISSCYFIFHDVERVIYGYVMMIVCAVTLDTCTRRVHQAVKFEIFSRNYSMIADAINEAGFGTTVLDGTGWYTKSERNVLICICSRRYQDIIMRVIKRVDPFAFFTVSNVSSVYGEGFGTMKTIIKDQKPIIVYATDDADRLTVIRGLLGGQYDIRSLHDVGCISEEELPDAHESVEESAHSKAKYVNKFYGFDVFAESIEGDRHVFFLIYKKGSYKFETVEQLRTFLMNA